MVGNSSPESAIRASAASRQEQSLRVDARLDHLCRTLEPYRAPEADAARFRARQLQTVLRLTPLAMVINVINAVIVVLALHHEASHRFLYGWCLAVTLASALGLRGWFRGRHRSRTSASRRAIRHAAIQAALLGAAWGTLPLVLFTRVGPPEQFLLGVVSTGMMCAGAFALASVPAAGTLWVMAIGFPSAVAIAQSNLPFSWGLVVMMIAYAGITVFGVWTAARVLGARLMAEARADHQHEVIGLLLRDFEDHASDLLWEIDRDGRFAHASRRLMQQFGIAEEQLATLSAVQLLQSLIPDTEEAQRCWRDVQRHLDQGTAFRDQILAVRSARGVHWWSISARVLIDDYGRTVGWRGVASDHTERHAAHSKLEWLAHNDALTGLVNRTQFRELLQQMLAESPASNPLAVVYIDLDGFKEVNDQYGHTAGDRLLKGFGERLLAGVRPNDTVARLGGDEFGIILRGIDSQSSAQTVLDRVLATLEHPVDIDSRQVRLRASIGVALAPTDGQDIDALMNCADIALYVAKHQGGGSYCFFHASLAENGRRRAVLEEALRGALDRQEMRLVYQPQVNASTMALCGFEALLRWRHPEHGDVSPAEFVPIAESIGLMPQLGQWVLSEACREATTWPEQLSLSVNVSPLQLRDPAFGGAVLQATKALATNRIELEVTESALIEDVDGAVAILRKLRELGFRVALDDFGTGYSALSYLRKFPFDVLKIDRSFVRDLGTDPEARIIVDTILAMSHALHMTTVAEGVESAEEADMLCARGCTVLQGYFVSAPIPAADLPSFMTQWAPRQRSSVPRLRAVS